MRELVVDSIGRTESDASVGSVFNTDVHFDRGIAAQHLWQKGQTIQLQPLPPAPFGSLTQPSTQKEIVGTRKAVLR